MLFSTSTLTLVQPCSVLSRQSILEPAQYTTTTDVAANTAADTTCCW